MSITIATLAEPLLAVLALEWTQASVHTQMINDVAKLCEVLLAGEALKLLVHPACLLVHYPCLSIALRFCDSLLHLDHCLLRLPPGYDRLINQIAGRWLRRLVSGSQVCSSNFNHDLVARLLVFHFVSKRLRIATIVFDQLLFDFIIDFLLCKSTRAFIKFFLLLDR